ncbi:cyclin-dependent kinase inhibitor 3 family protein [Luminiphilus sp.]|nr:cyclin-dependent kinase inhibitor 3 family protein [Luminiphilus sp.]
MQSKFMKTSISSPLEIAEIWLPRSSGYLGITLCPGKVDEPRQWRRDLDADLRAIRDWGAGLIVTLIEDCEFRLLGVEELEKRTLAAGMAWQHLPITDVQVPNRRLEDAWIATGPMVHQLLNDGQRVLVHCRGGLGRAGIVAARVLIEQGFSPDEAINKVRSVRPGAIETRAQESYVRARARRPA